jgi:CHAT domain-containing protein
MVVSKPHVSRRSGGRWPAFVLVVITLIVGAGAAIWWTRRGETRDRGTRPELRRLVEAVGAARPIEARLTGGFAYGPAPGPDRGSLTSRRVAGAAVLSALADLEQGYLGSDDPAYEAAWGAAALVAGDIEPAIAILESAASRSTDRADVWSDTSAAYLAGAAQLGYDEWWIRGLEAAERARQLQPDLAEARFNRALALEGLSLFDRARQAWEDYLALDPQSAWSAEARRRLSRVQREVGDLEWTAFKSRLEVGLPRVDTDDEANAPRFRQRLRLWIEQELIPLWASAWMAADASRAEQALSRASAAASLLRRVGGDPMPSDGVACVTSAVARDRRAADGLARAHLALPRIVRASDEGDYDRAAQEFEHVLPLLAAARSPYSAWGALYRSSALYMARELGLAESALATLDRSVPPASYLGGVRDWMQGLIDLNRNRWARGRDEYEAALRQFQTLGETDSVGRVSALLAEMHAEMGDSRRAWRYERLALAQATTMGIARRKHVILQLASLFCLRDEAPRAALEFQQGVIDIARARARVTSLVDGYLHRARIYARIGRLSDGHADLQNARALLPEIPSDALRDREAGEIDAATAEIGHDAQPEAAIDAASRALAYFARTSGQRRLSGLYLQRGRAHLARRQFEKATTDLASAVDEFEALRDTVLDRSDRVRLFKDGWLAYRAAARSAIEQRHDPAAALELAERARARTLLEGMMGPSAKPEPVSGFADGLPPSTAVLFYVTERDRLWLWVLTNDRAHFLDRPLSLHDLELRVGRLDRLFRLAPHAATDGLRVAMLRSLFVDLLTPVRSTLSRVRRLVIIPDGPLHRLPFAALIDPSTGQYVIETHEVAVAPSLTTLRRASRLPPIPGVPQALVIGDPTITSGDTPWRRLPFARAEARAVAGIYPGARLLLEESATRAAFLRALPAADIVHYAGHAVVDTQEPDRSHLLLGVDATSPEGLLFVPDLRGSTLTRHPLVVLAACSTNRGQIAIGEGVLSLARPFLEAGASAVLATLWDVQDRNGAALFTRVHRKIAQGDEVVSALAETQRDLLRASDPEARKPENWAWAVVIGGRPQ